MVTSSTRTTRMIRGRRRRLSPPGRPNPLSPPSLSRARACRRSSSAMGARSRRLSRLLLLHHLSRETSPGRRRAASRSPRAGRGRARSAATYRLPLPTHHRCRLSHRQPRRVRRERLVGRSSPTHESRRAARRSTRPSSARHRGPSRPSCPTTGSSSVLVRMSRARR